MSYQLWFLKLLIRLELHLEVSFHFHYIDAPVMELLKLGFMLWKNYTSRLNTSGLMSTGCKLQRRKCFIVLCSHSNTRVHIFIRRWRLLECPCDKSVSCRIIQWCGKKKKRQLRIKRWKRGDDGVDLHLLEDVSEKVDKRTEVSEVKSLLCQRIKESFKYRICIKISRPIIISALIQRLRFPPPKVAGWCKPVQHLDLPQECSQDLFHCMTALLLHLLK